jgi:predicted aspartyl protease
METLQAKMDTGAARTMIPTVSAHRLGLLISGIGHARAFDGRIVDVALYSANLKIAEMVLEEFEVGAINRAYILLGRDVLNQFDITLRGKAQVCEMSASEVA